MKNKRIHSNLSRRDFIKLATLAAGALAVTSCDVGTTTTEAVPTSTLEPEPTPTATPTPEYLPDASSVEAYELPAPQIEGGVPLMDALAKRKSVRDYSSEDISTQVLSNLLWAAFGVNRPQSGQRTAPSAHNKQDITIYVATAKGLFSYDAKGNSLVSVLSEDIRLLTTKDQANVAEAPIQLVYVSNYLSLSGSEQQKLEWSWAHTGLIAQNVYLFCASEGMASVVRSTFIRQTVEEAMGLSSFDHVTLVQAVGYPKEM